MAQRRGLHTLLEVPFIYECVQKIFTHKETLEAWSDLVRKFEGKVILDIGCGPGKDAFFFRGAKRYIGIDISERYIDSAKKNYSKFGEFYCLSIEDINQLPIDHVDIVILKGVYHHLNASSIDNFLKNIAAIMNNKGKICSIDPCFLNHRIVGNFIASLDRGMFIRKEDELTGIISKNMFIKSQRTIKQTFPPYQRILLELSPKSNAK